MPKKNPFHAVFDEISELLAVVQKNKRHPKKKIAGGPPPYEDLETQLDALERDLVLFRSITDQALEMEGISPKELEKRIKKPPETFAETDRKLLLRAKKLRDETLTLEKSFKPGADKLAKEKKARKTKGKKRKKKFRGLGGTDWLPL